MNRLPKRVGRVLAVGSPPADGMHRITTGKDYTCVAGSQEEHEVLHLFCEEIMQWLSQLGLDLHHLSPEELQQILIHFQAGEGRA